MNYKVELWGGDTNGAIRYYDTLGKAIGQARRYATRCAKKFGLCNDAYSEVYYKGKKGWVLYTSFGY